ncbi:MAG: DotD/TraH family lipoprotein [Nitrospiraceae bacterium]|nr:DotD/TraH family lipoprotein [Nitrospiraceae bacterium]
MTYGTKKWRTGQKERAKRRCFVLVPLFLSVCFSVLTGCASSSVSFKEKDKTILQDDSAPKILSIAALRISRDWDRLLAYQSHLPPQALGISRNQKAGIMGRRFTIKYVGPVEPFLRHLGKTVRWNVKTVGKRPASQPMIEIRSKKEPLYDILRDAGVQITPAAWIVLRPEGREIDLIYPPPIPSRTSKTQEGRVYEK